MRPAAGGAAGDEAFDLHRFRRGGRAMNHGMGRSTLLTVVLCAGLAWRAVAARQPISGMPLVWKPTTELSEIGPVNLTGLSGRKLELALVDAREDKAKVGENVEKAGAAIAVSTKDDVPAFVADRLRFVFGKVGLDFATTAGDSKVTLELRRFFVTEKDTYEGEVMVKVTVAGAGGKVLYEGMASGGSTRFGRSFKPDNYNETLSDSIIDLVKKLVASGDFMAALRGGH
jgi:hypothetical protein